MKPSTLNRASDYERAVQELDGPAEARVARVFAWLVFQAAALFCWVEREARRWLSVQGSGQTLSQTQTDKVFDKVSDEVHGVGPSLHPTRCPHCRTIHTNGSFFCSDPCARDFFNLAHVPSASVEVAGPGQTTVLTQNKERTAV